VCHSKHEDYVKGRIRDALIIVVFAPILALFIIKFVLWLIDV